VNVSEPRDRSGSSSTIAIVTSIYHKSKSTLMASAWVAYEGPRVSPGYRPLPAGVSTSSGGCFTIAMVVAQCQGGKRVRGPS
jgi:hypothetical protein